MTSLLGKVLVLCTFGVMVAAGQFGVMVAAGQHAVALTWTLPISPPEPAGTTYNVARKSGSCPAPPMSGFTVLVTGLTGQTWTDTTVLPGPYCYYVESQFAAVVTGPSPVAGPTVTPFAPPAPTISANLQPNSTWWEVHLAWKDTKNLPYGLTGYKIYRAPTACSGAPAFPREPDTKPIYVSTYVDGPLIPSVQTVVCYQITAVQNDVEGPPSPMAGITLSTVTAQ